MEFTDEVLAYGRIIDLLSPASQSLLFSLDRTAAACQLRFLRTLAEQWELAGITLDPIQQEVILDSIVAHLVANALVDEKGYKEIYDLGFAAGVAVAGTEGS
jgi:hypothetical protein